MTNPMTQHVPVDGRGHLVERPTRAMTYGEHAVGLSFNPSGDPRVAKLKEHYAAIIDMLHELRMADGTDAEERRLYDIAVKEAQGAQMWAVKAATWRK